MLRLTSDEKYHEKSVKNLKEVEDKKKLFKNLFNGISSHISNGLHLKLLTLKKKT